MKANASMLGGSMEKTHYASYAQYFVKFLQAYAAAGVPVDAVTIQNEVDTDQDGRMPACLWRREYEIEFISRHLGPQFARNNLATKIWILDHNYNLWGRAICTLDEPGPPARRFDHEPDLALRSAPPTNVPQSHEENVADYRCLTTAA